jgi:hypothetical protein
MQKHRQRMAENLICDSSQAGETRFLLTLPLSSIG